MASAVERPPDIVYTAASPLSAPRVLFRAMGHDLRHSRELAWRLARRDISARYRQSVLGVVWAFIPAIVTTAVFVFLNRAGIVTVAVTDTPYPVHVMFGTVLWSLFSSSLTAPIGAVNHSTAMLSKINFPREAIILAAMLKVLFDFSIQASLLVLALLLFGVPLGWGLLLAPLGVVMLMLFGFALGLLLTPLGALYTDVVAGLNVLVSFWFFVTPVVYPVPTEWPWRLILYLNPVSPLLVGTRELATRSTLTDAVPFLVVSVLTILGLLVGWVLYRVSLPILIERMSA